MKKWGRWGLILNLLSPLIALGLILVAQFLSK